MSAERFSLAFEEQVRRFSQALSRARRGDGKGVHQARVASRRIREMLPLVDSGPVSADTSSHWRRIRRDVRRLATALGAVRELDVTRALLADSANRFAWRQESVTPVMQDIDADRGRRHAEFLEVLREVRPRTLLRELRTTGGQAPPGTAALRDVLNRRRRKRAAALAGSLRALGTLYLPDKQHEVRLAAKKLRYSLEIEGAVVPRAPVARDVRTLTAIQEHLGQLHDLQVLQARLRGSVRALERGEARRLTSALERECRALHAQAVARAPVWLNLANRVAGR